MNTPEKHENIETAQIVAANLRRALKDNRWSERQAAAALGLTPAYVNRRASGDTELSASDLAMFSAFLKVPVQNFFTQITVLSLASVTALTPRPATSVERDEVATVTRIRVAR